MLTLFMLLIFSQAGSAGTTWIPEEKEDNLAACMEHTSEVHCEAVTTDPPPVQLDAEIKYPRPDTTKPQFILAYGSLLEKKSRSQQLADNTPIYPVYVKGFTRGWFASNKNLPEPRKRRITYLGVLPDQQKVINMLLHPVSLEELKKLDKREGLYLRRAVSTSQLSFPEDVAQPENLETGQVWIYQLESKDNKEFELSGEENPIYYSYVLTVMLGCHQIAQDFNLPGFFDECIYKSTNWSEFIAFDLDDPVIANFNSNYQSEDIAPIDEALRAHTALKNFLIRN